MTGRRDNFKLGNSMTVQDRYRTRRVENLPSSALSFPVEMFYRNHPPDLVGFGLNFMQCCTEIKLQFSCLRAKQNS